MKKVRIGINGFGRIGRITTRVLLQNTNAEIVAINDLTDAKTLAHLFKYDSVHRSFKGSVAFEEHALLLNGHRITIVNQKDPALLPWKEMDIDVVIESTGLFRTKEDAEKHLQAGAKKVIISAPGKSGIKTIVLGINDGLLDKTDTIISNASCTTNCAAPMVDLIDKLCGIEYGFVSTVHSYTNDQRIHDAPHSDLRRARAAGLSIIPTTTGAAETVVKVFPHLKGKLAGSAVRVPVPTGSLTEVTVFVKSVKSAKEINAVFQDASKNSLKGIVEYTEDEIVSTDIIGNPHSVIFDAGLTEIVGNLVKIGGWYDNESGYSNRLAEIAVKVGLMM